MFTRPDILSLSDTSSSVDTLTLSPAAAAVRAALLDGLTTVDAFAEGSDKSKRTVDGWIAQGMPTVRVGRTVYIPIAEARAWLLKPGKKCAAPRSPGRPANKKAA